MITVAEAAERLNLSPSALQRRCKAGKVPGAVLKGKTWLIPERSLSKIVRLRAPPALTGGRRNAC